MKNRVVHLSGRGISCPYRYWMIGKKPISTTIPEKVTCKHCRKVLETRKQMEE